MTDYKTQYKELLSVADKKPTGPAEELVLMVHAVNLANGLKCLVEDKEYVLPQSWSKHHEGVYFFMYMLPSKKRVQFRLVDSGDQTLSVNFVVDGSETLNQIALKVSDNIESNGEKYQKQLREKIEQKTYTTTTHQGFRAGNLEPVPLNVSSPEHLPPRPLGVGPRIATEPFPRGGMFGPEGELVGPNSAIFRGEGNQGGFYREDIRPNLPLGARYDPVHPFDGPQGRGGLNPGSEFFGFDEFGRPITKPGQGPSRGGFGGFGGFGGPQQPRDFL